MQMQPSTNSPSANTRPPSITMNRAKAIAGTAASSRAPRSERAPSCCARDAELPWSEAVPGRPS